MSHIWLAWHILKRKQSMHNLHQKDLSDKSHLHLCFYRSKWGKVFTNGSSKICGRQPLKHLEGYGLFKHLKAIFHKFFFGPFLNTLPQMTWMKKRLLWLLIQPYVTQKLLTATIQLKDFKMRKERSWKTKGPLRAISSLYELSEISTIYMKHTPLSFQSGNNSSRAFGWITAPDRVWPPANKIRLHT